MLKRDHQVVTSKGGATGKQPFKKAGSVGVIVTSPITNDYAYLIRFADTCEIRAKRDDLTGLRSDAPEQALAARDISAYEPYLIYRVIMGSQAYGLADDTSDRDERGVYLPPAEAGGRSGGVKKWLCTS